MDIVVGPHGAQTYLRGADLAPCMCDVTLFPALGECIGESDASVCLVPDKHATCESCMTKRSVEGNELVMAGCGRDETRIPLGDTAFITPVVTATIDADMVTVSWTTDTPAASALVTIGGFYTSVTCHIATATQYTFAQPWETPRFAGVTALTPPSEIDTAFGHATIWRGDSGSVMFSAP
jgi:hypothetical protein